MSTARHIEKVVCRRCYTVLDVDDNFCRHCGAPLRDVAPPEAAPGRPGNRQKWMESRWAVLVSLFFLFGPLALPMLWRSRQFSPVWKIILTTLVLGATALIIGLLWYVVNKALEPLTDLRELQGL